MNPEKILSAFPKLSALVVGDICLDRWCTYDPDLSEPSRETGIPRLAVVSTEVTPGAGGTIANNLIALGTGRVEVLGVCGIDGHGAELKAALTKRSIGSEFFVETPDVPTFTYTKLINSLTGEEDRPRVDFVRACPMPIEVERQVLAKLELCAKDFDVILVSDQAETAQGGVVTPAVRELLEHLAARYKDKIFWVDSRERPELFRNVIVKPNRQEAENACHRVFGKLDLPLLREHVQAPVMLVTLGLDGVQVIDDNGCEVVPTRPVEKPVDICGAGDSFSAGAAMALAVTGSPVAAAQFGNAVASITIMKKGTATASPKELMEVFACHS